MENGLSIPTGNAGLYLTVRFVRWFESNHVRSWIGRCLPTRVPAVPMLAAVLLPR